MPEAELVIAILSPQGRSAVATVAIEGPRAAQVVASIFRPHANRPFEHSRLGEIRVGRWGAPGGEEVVVCRATADRVEIHCHGGVAAAAAIVDTLVERGAQTIDWRAWLARETCDQLAVEAAEALAQATTARAAGILVDQCDGALRRAVNHARALVAAQRTSDALGKLESLAERYHAGKHLVEPFHIVLAGRPNVGKSSLMNRLGGYQRAIVFDQPGTTRDVVTLRTAIDGWPVELADTAGIRATADTLEAEGVARAQARLATADLRILVFDRSHPWSIEDQQLLEAWPTALTVMNKSDLRAEGQAESSSLAGRPCLHTSAMTGQGIDELVSAIGERLVRDPLAKGAAVLFTARQHGLLVAACTALRAQDHATAMAALAAL